jgi:hypothetical protein
MRCMMCGAQMTLIRVVEDETYALVCGFERHAYMCSRCGDIEPRFVFNNHANECATEAVPGLTEAELLPTNRICGSGKGRWRLRGST